MNIKFITVVFAIFLISACANEPNFITLNPQVINAQLPIYQTHQVKLSVIDKRASSHLVEILTNDDGASFISTKTPIENVLNQQFRQEFTQQGLELNNSANIQIDFNLVRARTYVNQDVLDYRANTIIKLLVKIENQQQTLSKTFTQRATSRGPLTANIDEIQEDFNLQLSKLITQVLEDDQLQGFIKG